MTLYACGFNAHGQLLPSSSGQNPENLHTLQKIAEGDQIRVCCALWSATVLEIDGALIFRGYHRSQLQNCEIEGPPASDFTTIFGDTSGVLGAVTRDGGFWTLCSQSSLPEFKKHVQNTFLDSENLVLDHIAIAGNEQVCMAAHKRVHALIGGEKMRLSSSSYSMHTFPTLASFLASRSPSHSYTIPAPLTSLFASNTSFTALSTNSDVYIFGDPRHCPFGRIPKPLAALGGVPIAKVATGGWVSAALSRDKDLYIYGGRPGEEERMECLPVLNCGEEVSLVDLEGGVDVRDVGVGAGHVVALTESRGVWGTGDSGSGQLGVGKRMMDVKMKRPFQKDWVRMGGEEVWGKNMRPVGVEAGEWGTFVLVERTDGG